MPATVPVPLSTLQDWVGLLGFLDTVTLNWLPSSTVLLYLNGPSELIFKESPFMCSTRPVPIRPLTEPLRL